MSTDEGRDDGFTLVELLIAITMVGALVGVLASAASQSIRLTASTGQSLSDSSTRFIVSHKILDDVRNAAAVGVSENPVCAGPPGGDLVFWARRQAGAHEVVAAYFVDQGTSTEPSRLYRALCVPADAGYVLLAAWPGAGPGSGKVVVRCGDEETAVGCGTDSTVHVTIPAGLDPHGGSKRFSVTATRRQP